MKLIKVRQRILTHSLRMLATDGPLTFLTAGFLSALKAIEAD